MKFFLSAVTLVLILASCNDKIEKIDVKNECPIINEFGFLADSLIMNQGQIKKYQTFSDILLQNKIPFNVINEILDRAGSLFDFRKIKVGNNYYTYSNADSVNSLKHFVYCENAINSIVISFSDSITVKKISKKIETRERVLTGKIDKSLWAAFEDLNTSPMLAIKLSEVFAWQIDFFRIQKGDKFKVVYTETYADDTFIGIDEIKAVVFTHMNQDYYAIPLVQNGVKDFYDLDGKSLKKAFLKAPLKFSRISSQFSNSRFHPVLRIYRPHHGIDFSAPVGTPVQAVGDGNVVFAGSKRAEGKYIKIKHNGTYTSGYMHLSKFESGIKEGARVRQGDIIGYVGSTGLSTGPHLDFRFWINEKPANYLTLEFPSAYPVDKSNFEEFVKTKNEICSRFDKIDVYPDFRGLPIAFSVEKKSGK